MKKIVDWLFKPYNCQYEPNWSTQCYNHAWGLLIVLDFVLIFTLATLTVMWGEDQERVGMFLTLLGFVLAIFLGNLVQLSVSCRLWPEHCEKLYEELTNGGSR